MLPGKVPPGVATYSASTPIIVPLDSPAAGEIVIQIYNSLALIQLTHSMSDRHQSSEGCQIPSATLRHGRGAPEGARDHSTGKTSYLYQFIKSSLYKRSVEKSQMNTMRI